MNLKTEKENSQSQTRNKSFAWMKYILCFKIVLEYLTVNLIAQIHLLTSLPSCWLLSWWRNINPVMILTLTVPILLPRCPLCSSTLLNPTQLVGLVYSRAYVHLTLSCSRRKYAFKLPPLINPPLTYSCLLWWISKYSIMHTCKFYNYPFL